MTRTICTAILVAALVAVPAKAGPYDDGFSAFQRLEYELALKLLRPIADQGDARAQTIVGMIVLETGRFNDDLREAQGWFLLAAEQGFAPAQERLGYTYLMRPFENYAEAEKWFRLAAEQGFPLAMVSLGNVLDSMQRPEDERNPEEAAEWYLKAANDGFVYAFDYVSNIYFRGRGVPRDYAESLRWKMLIVEHGGVSKTAGRVAAHYEGGLGVKQNNIVAYMWYEIGVLSGADKATEIQRDTLGLKMSADEIAKAKRMAREWIAEHRN